MKIAKFLLVLTGMTICFTLVAVLVIMPRSSMAESSASQNPAPPRPSTPIPGDGGDGGDEENEKAPLGSLEVHVWDLFSKAPAPDATVKVGDMEFVTGNEGWFHVNLDVGTYEVAIQIPPDGVPTEYSSAKVNVGEGSIWKLDLNFFSQPPLPICAAPTPTPVPSPTPSSASSPVPKPVSKVMAAGMTSGGASCASSPLTVFTGGPPTVRVNPDFANYEIGKSGCINIDVADLSDFGGFQGELNFDPEIVEIESVKLGDLLGSTGRRVDQMEPMIDNQTGKISFGAYSSGRVAGPNGGGTLVTTNFTTKGEGHSKFDLENVILVSRLGHGIKADIVDGSISVSACFGDLNGDKIIDIKDIQVVAGRVGRARGDPNYEQLYDLDFNGQIDKEDVEIVATRWNHTCP